MLSLISKRDMIILFLLLIISFVFLGVYFAEDENAYLWVSLAFFVISFFFALFLYFDADQTARFREARANLQESTERARETGRINAIIQRNRREWQAEQAPGYKRPSRDMVEENL